MIPAEPTAIGLATADSLLSGLRPLIGPVFDQFIRRKLAIEADMAAAEMRRMAVSEILTVVRSLRQGIIDAAKDKMSDPYWKGAAGAAKAIVDQVEKIAVGWAS